MLVQPRGLCRGSACFSVVRLPHPPRFRKESPVFVSFFPSPRTFFWSALIWSLIVVLFWFFGGEGLGAAFGLPPRAADDAPTSVCRPSGRRHSCGSTFISSCGGDLCRVVDVLLAASLAELVDPWLGADRIRDLFPGSGECRHQQLVRPLLRLDPEGVVGAEPRDGRRNLRTVRALRRHRLRLRRCHRAQPVLCPDISCFAGALP